MRLTPEQCDWVDKERETLRRIIASKPREGWVSYPMRLEALNLLVEMHNIAVAAERKAAEEKEARIKKEKNV